MAIATVLGLLLGMGTVVAQSLLYRKIRTSEDVEHELGLPVLGMIPDTNSMRDYDEKKNTFWRKLRKKLWRR